MIMVTHKIPTKFGKIGKQTMRPAQAGGRIVDGKKAHTKKNVAISLRERKDMMEGDFIDRPKPSRGAFNKSPKAIDKKVEKTFFKKENRIHKNNSQYRADDIIPARYIAHPALKHYAPHEFLYGTHAVKAALQNPKRILKILLVTPQKQADYQHLAENSNFKVLSLTPEEISAVLPTGAVHQGMALAVVPLNDPDENELYDTDGTVMVLDGVTDPHNIGAILRSAAAFGCKSLVMQDRHAPSITGSLAKAAAGAVEQVDIYRVTNIARTLRTLQNKGFMVYGADGDADNNLLDINFLKKSVIVMGAEGDGMRRLVREACDMIIRIPMAQAVQSLNVSVASAIILSTVFTKTNL